MIEAAMATNHHPQEVVLWAFVEVASLTPQGSADRGRAPLTPLAGPPRVL